MARTPEVALQLEALERASRSVRAGQRLRDMLLEALTFVPHNMHHGEPCEMTACRIARARRLVEDFATLQVELDVALRALGRETTRDER